MAYPKYLNYMLSASLPVSDCSQPRLQFESKYSLKAQFKYKLTEQRQSRVKLILNTSIAANKSSSRDRDFTHSIYLKTCFQIIGYSNASKVAKGSLSGELSIQMGILRQREMWWWQRYSPPLSCKFILCVELSSRHSKQLPRIQEFVLFVRWRVYTATFALKSILCKSATERWGCESSCTWLLAVFSPLVAVEFMCKES